jgi:hypothetical protein
MSKQRLTLLVAIAATLVSVLSGVFLRLVPNGGENTPTYQTMRFLEIPVQILLTFSSIAALAAFITLGFLGVQSKIPSTVEFSKFYKFIRMRRLALLIAGIPGIALSPFAIAAIISFLPASNLRNETISALAIVSMSIIVPGMMAMIAFLVMAITTAFMKPIDPAADRPKPHLLQIWLAAVTAALPAVAMLTIWLNAFRPQCDTGVCSNFDDPIVPINGVLYVVMWLVLATIWLRSKRAK